jgi:uncharacterized protein YvpB
MATPYHRTVGVVHWAGKALAQSTIDAVVATLVHEAPNVKAVYVMTSDGADWQGLFDDPANKHDLAILGPDDIARWVRKLGAADIDFHAWAVLKGKDIEREAQRVAAVCNVPGVKSMLLDVEDGEGNFSGGPLEARALIERIRAQIPPDFHLGLALAAHGQHPEAIHIEEWLPYVQSLHPMVYHRVVGLQPEIAVANAFAALRQFNKPIVPVLQAHNGVPGSEMVRAANAAFDHGAPGVSFFRLGAIERAGFEYLRTITPPAEPAETPLPFTCQELINAFRDAAVAAGLGSQYWQLVERADLEWLATQRHAIYDGPPIADLPGLTEAEKKLILQALTGQAPPDEDEGGLDTPGEIVGEYTNQQIINAFSRAATALGQGSQYWSWVEAAGLAHLAQQRRELYAGPMIDELPNLNDQQKLQIASELREMTPITAHKRLEVPWISQLDNKLPNDCGHACVLMLLKYAGLGDDLAVGDLFSSGVAPRGYTTAWHLVRLAEHYGLRCTVESPFSAVDYFIEQINADKPVIVLADYASLRLPRHLPSGPNQGAHWLVVVGYDRFNYYVHDPLWLPEQIGGAYGEGGRWHPIPRETMESAVRAVRSRTCVYPAETN